MNAPDVKAPTSSMLGEFAGERPEAPEWFRWALAQLPEKCSFAVEDAQIESLSWGRIGSPGLIFVHGNLGHADWWSYIAPFFAESYRVSAISLSGMGGSDHRAHYSLSQFGREIVGVAEGAGLFEGSRPPIIVAHSAGAGPAAHLADVTASRWGGVVFVDTGIRPAAMMPPQPPPRESNPVYPTLEDALASYRLAPAQKCANPFIIDWIARRALKTVDGGWTWRFDPKMYAQVRASEAWEHLVAARCRFAFINGALSKLTPAERVAYVRSRLAANTPFITIPEAAHHVMVDQPLALVSALRSVLALWEADDRTSFSTSEFRTGSGEP